MLADWLRKTTGDIPTHGVLTTIETETKYAGYIAQQERQISRLKDSSSRRIPSEFQFGGIPGLSTEVRQKLERVRPETLGQAESRSQGDTCGDRDLGHLPKHRTTLRIP